MPAKTPKRTNLPAKPPGGSNFPDDELVARIERGIVRPREVHLVILKQVIARDEVIGVWKAAGFRTSHPQMTLGADGSDGERVWRMLFR